MISHFNFITLFELANDLISLRLDLKVYQKLSEK